MRGTKKYKIVKCFRHFGAIIILLGAAVTIGFALIPGIGGDFANGVLSGALTSTPAFSAAKQVAKEEGLVALGHAVAYPFGVIGVVLFVQIIPKLVHADMAKEREAIAMTKKVDAAKEGSKKKLFELDEFGLAVVLGILLGSIRIPLTSKGFDGATFSLGTTGGPLIMALILGHFGHIGRLSLRIPDHTLKVFREFGLMLFLIGAGVEGGVEVVYDPAIAHMASPPWFWFYNALARFYAPVPMIKSKISFANVMTSPPASGRNP